MNFNHKAPMSILFPLRHWIKIFCSVGVMFVLIFAVPSHSAIYTWKDDKGQTHFTDDASKIPAEYRRKDELKTMDGAPADPSEPVKLNIPESKNDGGAIPVEAYGNGHFLVEVLLNGRIKAKLMVDTGASMVVLSERVGKLLKVSGNKSLPILDFDTAGGKVEHTLFILNSIKAGKAKVFGVEAAINSHFTNAGDDGVLGMSFLGEFKLEMDRTNHKMYLKPIAKRGEMKWGGYNEAWWRKKYKTYVGNMRYYRNLIDNYMMIPKERNNYRKLITHYFKLHEALEKRADYVDLPKEFRVYP